MGSDAWRGRFVQLFARGGQHWKCEDGSSFEVDDDEKRRLDCRRV